MPVAIGPTTAIAAAIATQASAAVPPSSRTRRPVTAAAGCSQATAPLVPKTVERPPRSGRRTRLLSVPLSLLNKVPVLPFYDF